MERWEVHFTGHVQGVGFRHATLMQARNFDVVGYVQNLPDGRVRLVAEGETGELKRLVEAIEGQMGGHIRQTQTDRRAANGEFHEFSIRY